MKLKTTTFIYLVLCVFFVKPEISCQTVNDLTLSKTYNPASGAWEEKVKHTGKSHKKIKADLEFDCETDFWTVNSEGEIQQWSLIEGAVSGGEIIIHGCGGSLAFCKGVEMDGNSFYSTEHPNTGISFYDGFDNWWTISTSELFVNNGGSGINQYFLESYFGYNRVIFHFNVETQNLVPLDNIYPAKFSMADIAVDSMGRAWAFVGEGGIGYYQPSQKINVYDHTGLISSIPLNAEINTYNGYGSTFINDTLYIALGDGNPDFPEQLIPVSIHNDTAFVGTGIPFPEIDNYDLAGCHCENDMVNSVREIRDTDGIEIFPNPTTDHVYIHSDEEVLFVEVYNVAGRLINQVKKNDVLSLTKEFNGIYILKIYTEKGIFIEKVIKS